MIVRASKLGLLHRGQLTTVIVARQPLRPCPYSIGDLYQVRTGPQKPAAALVEVHGIALTAARDVDERIAHAAGYDDLGEFAADWRRRYHGVKDERTAPLETDDPAWVVWFEVAGDVPRLLPRKPVRPYTHRRHQAMVDEPEAVSEAVQDAQTSEAHDAYQRRWAERQAQWNEKTRAQRLADVEAHNRMAGGTVGRKELRTIDALLEKARRKQMREEQAA